MQLELKICAAERILNNYLVLVNTLLILKSNLDQSNKISSPGIKKLVLC